jgi:hypothetical protein
VEQFAASCNPSLSRRQVFFETNKKNLFSSALGFRAVANRWLNTLMSDVG